MTNPIIERELIGMLRTRRALAIQVCLASVLALLVVLRWPTDARVDISGTQAMQVFRVFGYGLTATLILLVPVFPATTIVKEKVQGTLALLLNSPMHPWSIYLGKLVGVVGFVLLLMLLSLPAAAACYAMGGIALFSGLVQLYLVLFLVAIQYAALGLLVSSYSNTTDAALRITYGLILLLGVVTLGPYQFLQGQDMPAVVTVAQWIRSISPIPAVMEIMGHGDVGSQGLAGAGDSAVRYAVLAVVTTIGFMVWTASRLDQTMFDRARDPGIMTEERTAGQRAFRRVMFLWYFDPQRRTELIGVRWVAMFRLLVAGTVFTAIALVAWRVFEGLVGNIGLAVFGALAFFFFALLVAQVVFLNPVTVKEFRCRRFGRSHWMVRLVAACALVSLGLTYISTSGTIQWGADVVGGIMVVLQVALIVLLTPSLAAGLIASERESGGWQLLQMTPLPAGKIVRGKLMSVVWTLALILLATLPGYVVMMYINPEMWRQILLVLACLLLTAVFALLMSAAVSSLCRRTAAATTISYTLLVGICAGTMLVWLGRDAPFSHHVVENVLKINPMAAAMQIIDVPGFAQYDLVPANWWIMGAGCAICLVILGVQTWRLTRPQ